MRLPVILSRGVIQTALTSLSNLGQHTESVASQYALTQALGFGHINMADHSRG